MIKRDSSLSLGSRGLKGFSPRMDSSLSEDKEQRIQ